MLLSTMAMKHPPEHFKRKKDLFLLQVSQASIHDWLNMATWAGTQCWHVYVAKETTCLFINLTVSQRHRWGVWVLAPSLALPFSLLLCPGLLPMQWCCSHSEEISLLSPSSLETPSRTPYVYFILNLISFIFKITMKIATLNTQWD